MPADDRVLIQNYLLYRFGQGSLQADVTALAPSFWRDISVQTPLQVATHLSNLCLRNVVAAEEIIENLKVGMEQADRDALTAILVRLRKSAGANGAPFACAIHPEAGPFVDRQGTRELLHRLLGNQRESAKVIPGPLGCGKTFIATLVKHALAARGLARVAHIPLNQTNQHYRAQNIALKIAHALEETLPDIRTPDARYPALVADHLADLAHRKPELPLWVIVDRDDDSTPIKEDVVQLLTRLVSIAIAPPEEDLRLTSARFLFFGLPELVQKLGPGCEVHVMDMVSDEHIETWLKSAASDRSELERAAMLQRTLDGLQKDYPTRLCDLNERLLSEVP